MSEENENGTEGGKGLRSQLETALEELKTLKTDNAKYKAVERASTVRGILKAKGLPDDALHVADLYGAEDVSEGAVGKWLETYGGAFRGANSTSGDAGNGQQADANAANAARVNGASSGDADNGSENLSSGVLGDPEDLMRLLNSAPDYDTLVKAGLMPALPK